MCSSDLADSFATRAAKQARDNANAAAIAKGQTLTEKQLSKVYGDTYDRVYSKRYADLQEETEDLAQVYSVEGGGVPLSQNAVTELKDNNLSAALADITDTSDNEFDRSLAQRLIPLLRNTQVVVKDSLTDNEGNPVAGGASPNGRFIYLDAKTGLNEETVLHEEIGRAHV